MRNCIKCLNRVDHPWHDNGQVNTLDMAKWMVGSHAAPLYPSQEKRAYAEIERLGLTWGRC